MDWSRKEQKYVPSPNRTGIQLKREDLSQERKEEDQSQDWKALYMESQKSGTETMNLVRALSRIKTLEDRQDQLETKKSQLVETSVEKKSEYSSNTEHYKMGWRAKEKWNSNEDFKDWLARIELEVGEVRPKELYWRQLCGELLFCDMSATQQEMFYERSRQLLLSLKFCLAGTKAMSLIRNVRVDKTKSVTGGELAFKILMKCPKLFERNEVLRNKIVKLFMPADRTLDWYMELGLQLETDLAASPVMELEEMVRYWAAALLPEYENVCRYPVTNELEMLKKTGEYWCFQDIITVVVNATTKWGEPYEGEKWLLNGEDISKSMRIKLPVVAPDYVTGTRTNPVGTASTDRSKWTCTNEHCESKSNHSTDYCVSYKGAKEGQYAPHWPEEFKSRLKKELQDKIKKNGPSGVSTNSTGTGESHAVIMKRIKADMQLAVDIDPNKTMEGLNENCAEMDKKRSKPEDSEEETW